MRWNTYFRVKTKLFGLFFISLLTTLRAEVSWGSNSPLLPSSCHMTLVLALAITLKNIKIFQIHSIWALGYFIDYYEKIFTFNAKRPRWETFCKLLLQDGKIITFITKTFVLFLRKKHCSASKNNICVTSDCSKNSKS